MLIAGGVYAETCVTPERTALFGSGGRAAMVVAGLSRDVVLHTFQPEHLRDDVEANFGPAGIRIVTHSCPHRLCFEYLHPLSRPRIVPMPTGHRITVEVDGEKVLRFGCLEGDFRVTAARAVYDPQGGFEPVPFEANGSNAGTLAVILNANELRRMSGIDDLGPAAVELMGDGATAVVVVKDGSAGAYVFGRSEAPLHVPAYPTATVYKIGSGDVFSATFADAWLSKRIGAADAADLASRRTAQYVETPVFPLPSALPPSTAWQGDGRRRRVLLVFGTRTASQRWAREEAVRGLRDLGATVVLEGPPRYEDGWAAPPSVDPTMFDIVLIHVDDARTATAALRTALVLGKPVVAFAGDPDALAAADELNVPGADDLCSALYRTQWVSF